MSFEIDNDGELCVIYIMFVMANSTIVIEYEEPAPVGYPGQFHGVMTLEQAMRG